MTKFMIGVVLWSDAAEQKAVFWCEDHGDLAYYDASRDEGKGKSAFCAGDMVEFDLSLERQVRRAHNASLIRPKVCHGLQDHLRANAKRQRAKNAAQERGGEVIAFSRKTANGSRMGSVMR
ncbi:hypothetical protein AB2B41_03550 [Marimonas sp. MJW-29]|uniref:Uncharacterized protein n=1 Tax=Sulfitobacter sediminis TaxID=3234186 RepID=A0ABV3RJ52_9RHOB